MPLQGYLGWENMGRELQLTVRKATVLPSDTNHRPYDTVGEETIFADPSRSSLDSNLNLHEKG